mmetsp:Transcript_117293/g.343512  ORF Transcript_117293/g.343512 Transcript_117293/m.343512 type:complete len:245 (+) Transcript_117293:1376-2110(+)
MQNAAVKRLVYSAAVPTTSGYPPSGSRATLQQSCGLQCLGDCQVLAGVLLSCQRQLLLSARLAAGLACRAGNLCSAAASVVKRGVVGAGDLRVLHVDGLARLDGRPLAVQAQRRVRRQHLHEQGAQALSVTLREVSVVGWPKQVQIPVRTWKGALVAGAWVRYTPDRVPQRPAVVVHIVNVPAILQCQPHLRRERVERAPRAAAAGRLARVLHDEAAASGLREDEGIPVLAEVPELHLSRVGFL